jgi:hypothetical protein
MAVDTIISSESLSLFVYLCKLCEKQFVIVMTQRTHVRFNLKKNFSSLFRSQFCRAQMSSSAGLIECVVLLTLMQFFNLTNFFWMMVEGESKVRQTIYVIFFINFSPSHLSFVCVCDLIFSSYRPVSISTGCGDVLTYRSNK